MADPDRSRLVAGDATWMSRALQLAHLGLTGTSPNPMVGAVIVSAGGRILGEGYHARDGGAHAEVVAFAAVAAPDRPALREATLYVTLEPCSIFGRTPPCADLIVRERVARVVVGCIDFTPGVCGRGLERIRAAGIPVELGVCQAAAFELSRFRQATVRNHRPYVILKQAISADGFVGRRERRVAITGPLANRVSHAWRAAVDAVVVGAGTVLADDPALTTRLATGPSPLRVAVDLHGDLALGGRRLTAGPGEPYIFRPGEPDTPWVPTLLAELHERRVGRVLVEGGPRTLAAFVAAGQWDEYRAWTSPHALGGDPDAAPIPAYRFPSHGHRRWRCGADTLTVSRRLRAR